MSIEDKLSKLGKTLDKFCSTIQNVSLFGSSEKQHRLHHSSSASVSSSYVILIFDNFIAFLSIFISIHLRIGMDFLDYSPTYIIKNMFVFALVSSSVFLWFQTHQSFWKYTSIEDMAPIFLSVILSNIIFFPLMMLMNQEDFLPYSVLIINIFVLSLLLLIPRFLTRIIYNQRVNKMKKFGDLTRKEPQMLDTPPVLLIGNNESIDVFLREVIINEEVSFNFEPVGILTLNPSDIGRMIKGVPIVGEVRNLMHIIRELNQAGTFPRQLVITEKTIPESEKKFLVQYVQDHGLLLMHVIHQYTFNTVLE
jgi:O-antigen biosynthesis protein WbqV